MSTAGCELCHKDCYAVMGNPIEHSKSPVIHQMFARQTGQVLSYEALLVAMDGFAEAVATFMMTGGKGLNVTVPFKQEAWEIADKMTPGAQLAGAVNTLMIRNSSELFGDNTDGIGLVRDLTANLGIELSGKNILMLGAGGAARGVLLPLLEQRPAHLVIANRTEERAIQLAESFAAHGNLDGCGFQDLTDNKEYDVVINATSAGLHDQVPDLPTGVIGPQTCCYDMMYSSQATAFQRYARQLGTQLAFDGLGMLVEQAAESFNLWRNVRPDTKPVIEALRSSA